MAQKNTLVIVTGIPAIDRKLKRLPGRVQKKVLRKSMRTGIKIVAAEMKNQAPVDTGVTKANVKVRAVKKRSRNEIEIEAKISADPRLYKTSAKTGKTVFTPAIVEYGSSGHAPNPFGRRAFQAKGETARQATMVAIVAGIEEEARKP